MRIEVQIVGSVRGIMEREATAVRAGAIAGIRAQTRETQNAARAVVAAGLTARAARTIRSRTYTDGPAGFVYSRWGFFKNGQFVDVLASHERGGVITAQGKMMFIPIGRRRRRVGSQLFDSNKVVLIPTKSGGYLVLPRRKGRGGAPAKPIGLLTPRIHLKKVLDFTAVEQQAEAGLQSKVLNEIGKAADRA